MNTKHFQCFLMLAKYQNFSKAAEQLCISQPALSRQIADMEKQFGVQLFVRSSRSVELTTAGLLLRNEASSLIHHLEQLTLKMRSANNGYTGHVRLAALGHISEIFHQIWKNVHAQMAGCEFELEQYDQETLKDALLSRQIDCALTPAFPLIPFQASIEMATVGTIRYCILVPLNDPLAHKEHIITKDLREKRLLLPEVSRQPALAEVLLKQSPAAVNWSANVPSILLKADAALGIGIVPEISVQACNSCGFAIRFVEDAPDREALVLAWYRNIRNPAVKHFIALYQEEYRRQQLA